MMEMFNNKYMRNNFKAHFESMFPKRMNHTGGAGFTLVELAVVIGVIGVITTVTLALLNPANQLRKARDTKRKADFAQIQSALELYRADENTYPASLPACGGTLSSLSGTVYLRNRPCDPRNTGQYIYRYVPSGSPSFSYSLIACLENVNDSEKDAANATAYCSGGTTNWSYTVTNP
jgi:prepilin-type N-terminal cleavage/methylation domain-containing protein